MDITYTLTPDDMLAFTHYAYRHTAEGRKTFLLMYAFPPFLLLLLVIPHLLRPRPDSLPQMVGFLLVGLAYVVFYPRFIDRAARVNFQKQLGGDESAPHLFRLDAQGIAISSPTGSTAFHWPTIVEIAVTDDHVFFFYNPRCAAILTRRAFRSAGQFDSFLEQARVYQRPHLSV